MQPERASDGVSIEPTDAALIERSLVEPNAFAGVFDRHFDAVHGYATRRLGRSLAEEIASETFILAFDGRATFDRTHRCASVALRHRCKSHASSLASRATATSCPRAHRVRRFYRAAQGGAR
jgi:hypothetical protein